MGAKSFRTPDTSEEAKLLAVINVLDFMKEVTADPTLIKKLSDEASVALDQLGAQKQAHTDALADLKRADELRDEIANGHESLRKQENDLAVEHDKKVAAFEKYKVDETQKLITAVWDHKKAVDDLAVAQNTHKIRQVELDGYATQLDTRSAEIDRRAEGHEQVLKSKTLAAERLLANREAALDKREAQLNIKATKIEELKKALKDD